MRAAICPFSVSIGLEIAFLASSFDQSGSQNLDDEGGRVPYCTYAPHESRTHRNKWGHGNAQILIACISITIISVVGFQIKVGTVGTDHFKAAESNGLNGIGSARGSKKKSRLPKDACH